MTYKTIQVTYDSGIATITLNRPDKRNAISFDLIDDLLGALKEVEDSDALVLILTGAGTAFSSGMDLENLKSLIGRSPEENLKDSETMVRLFRTLYEFPKVTIAAVNGAAIAGGTGLALLCDFTLAVPEAKFGYTEVRIGFVPAIVSTFLLRQVGEKQARDLLLSVASSACADKRAAASAAEFACAEATLLSVLRRMRPQMSISQLADRPVEYVV
jgi:methylglutaconyl-CoA hydratase